MKRALARMFGVMFLIACGSDEPTGARVNAVGAGTGGATGVGGITGGGAGAGAGVPRGNPAAPAGSPGGSGVCMATTVGTGRVSPDMLIVLDRSGSMRMDGVDRWGPSVAGLKQITASLQERVSFGLMAFPGTMADPVGGVVQIVDCTTLTDPLELVACLAGAIPQVSGGSCDAGVLNVPIAPRNAGAIASALDAMAPGGATPTAATLQAAQAELQKIQSGPDNPSAAKYVLLVTDGAPNCAGGFGGSDQDPAAVDASVAAIEAMARAGIKTFVMGYGTQNDARLKASLDRMAQAGDTGDTQHRPIEDEQSLVSTFQQITGTLLSCEFSLDQAVIDQSYVKVTFDGVQLNVGDLANGWTLSADRRKVTLQGGACARAKEDGHVIGVTVQCEPVAPLL
jgi:von Willebrand factor type A domain